MRTLSETLLASQKKTSSAPYVKIEAVNKAAGVVRVEWTGVYEGSEDDYFHAAAMPADGSLLRTRLTLPADSRKLYRQRTASPGTESDFSQWEYTGQYNVIALAMASLGTEASIIWIKTTREIRRFKSTDNGAGWGSAELIDYTITTTISGLAAAYNTSGDLAIFFIDQDKLYVKKQSGGQWQTKTMWDYTAGELSGVTVTYDGDWNLLITGQDTAGNYKMWALIYGDGGGVPAGNWSEPKELATAPAAGDFEYRQPFLDKPDVFRCSFIEKYTGTEPYSRPYLAHSIPTVAFSNGLWKEAEPFNLATECGLAITHSEEAIWLSTSKGVWIASLSPSGIDLTGDVISLRQETGEAANSLTVELKNDGGKYAMPGEGALKTLDTGCRLEIGVGFITPSGGEYSPGLAGFLEAYEHTSGNGRATLVLHARDGWRMLAQWSARQQLRWNKIGAEKCVREILVFILAKAGLKLEVKSQSAVIADLFPDFTVSPGDSGMKVIKKLLSMVPDTIFIEGDTAYLLNPQSTDNPVYEYGYEHPILAGRYRHTSSELNRVQIEGADAVTGGMILSDSFIWDEIKRNGERFARVSDRNMNTAEMAEERGDTVLRKTEMESLAGEVIVPVNCGQQMYDVIEITDIRAGLIDIAKRVTGITLICRPDHGEYRQRLALGPV